MFCGNQVEDLPHAILFCAELTHWWRLFLPQVLLAPPQLTFMEINEWFLDKEGLTELPKLFTVAWSIWGRRNKKVFLGYKPVT